MVPVVVALLLGTADARNLGQAGVVSRQGVASTGDTGDADTDVDTDTDTDTEPTTIDTGPLFPGPCTDCTNAAERASDPGGSPCSTGGSAPAALLWLPFLALIRRQSRS